MYDTSKNFKVSKCSIPGTKYGRALGIAEELREQYFDQDYMVGIWAELSLVVGNGPLHFHEQIHDFSFFPPTSHSC